VQGAPSAAVVVPSPSGKQDAELMLTQMFALMTGLCTTKPLLRPAVSFSAAGAGTALPLPFLPAAAGAAADAAGARSVAWFDGLARMLSS
jgi:hypothetical protein